MNRSLLSAVAVHLLMLCIFSPHVVAQQRGNADRHSDFIPVAERYERLSPDAAYCGPRILYFFARYAGRECTLDQVVGLCGTGPDGTVDLVSLANAAEALDLDPLLIEFSPEQLLDLGGPAIFCTLAEQSPQTPGASADRVVHYVGLVRSDGDAYRVVDPSLMIGDLRLSEEQLAQTFTGQALLLRGCPRPVVRPAWMKWRNVLGLIIGVLLAGGFAGVLVRRTIRRRRSVPRNGNIAKAAS